MRVFTFLLVVGATFAFAPPTPIILANSKYVRTTETSLNVVPAVFEGVAPAVQQYANIWTPLFHDAMDSGLLPDFILKWGHGAAMSSVLLSMGMIGSWMGWQIREGKGEETNALTLGESMREVHPKIMAGAFFFFLLGGQGGLVLLSSQGGSILESPHAISALAGMSLLAVQAALPFSAFGKVEGARTAHAYLGSATIVALFAHMATGIQLGLSL